MYVNPSAEWDMIRPYKIEEVSCLSNDSTISEPHLLEEILDVLLQINSPFICVQSILSLKEANAHVYHPHKIEYHPAIGDPTGVVQKLFGKLSISPDTESENPFFSSPLEANSMIEDWTIIRQAVYDLNRYGILAPGSSEPIIRQEASLTAQALSFALKQFLQEQNDFVIRLEEKLRQTDQLTLQTLWFHLQSVIETHNIIAKIVKQLYHPSPYNALQSISQGHIIFQYIFEYYKTHLGNQKHREIFMFLMEETAKPYLKILSTWIFEGLVCDPYGEFLVQETEMTEENEILHKSIRNYWDKKFSIRKESSLCLLDGLGDKILACGKYVHLLTLLQEGKEEETSVELDVVLPPDIPFSPSPRHYEQHINEHYLKVSGNLFSFLLLQEKILVKLRLLKSFYVMDRCDVYICFLQSAQADLQRKELNVEKLNAFLGLSLLNAGLSREEHGLVEFYVTTLDNSLLQHADSIHDSMSECESSFSLPGILLHEERITLNWRETEDAKTDILGRDLTSTGLNTVIGDHETLQYQLIHRYRVLLLTVHLHLSHARLRLFKNSKMSNNVVLVMQTSKLLNKMQCFVQNFNSYVAYQVIKFNWNIFEEKVQKAQTVDEFLDAHSQFLTSTLTHSLLSLAEPLCLLMKIMETCLSMARFVNTSCSSFQDQKVDAMFLENVLKHQKSFDIFLRKLQENIATREEDLEENVALLFQFDLVEKN